MSVRALLLLHLAAAACSTLPPESPMTPPPSEAEFQRQLDALESAVGDDVISRERAEQWMLRHADFAHPRLLKRLETRDRPLTGALALLPRFGRPESIPVLERELLTGNELTLLPAAQALASHPLPAAREALERALAAPRRETASMAADALMWRGESAACGALRSRLGVADAALRYHVVQAAGALQCLTAEDLAALGRDADADVRALAERLKQGGSRDSK
jgi:hypothetical protein